MVGHGGSELSPWVKIIAALVAIPLTIAVQVWTFWTIWVYLAGGTVPLLGWETGGNPLMAVVTLVIGEPIGMTLVYWAYMIVMLPLSLIFRRRVPDVAVED